MKDSEGKRCRMKKARTKEGIRTTGIPSETELEASPGYPKADSLARGPIVVIECVQDIPCNPCEGACPSGAIKVGNPITNLPVFDVEKCDGCGTCIPICPGQAIFRVDMTYKRRYNYRVLSYVPALPKKGDTVEAVDRAGDVICEAEVSGTTTEGL
jgi:Fe-S-cluster-containing hydrogenase component 2